MKPVFEKGKADWFSELPSVIKKCNDTIHSSTKMTEIEASETNNEKEVYSNLKDKRKIRKPKIKLGQLEPQILKESSARVIVQTIVINYIQ